MNIINLFGVTPVIPQLTLEAFVAPTDFDVNSQDVDISVVFIEYLTLNPNTKYVFSVGTSALTVLPAVSGRSYAYCENGGSYTTITSGTITWTTGSTMRHVVVIDSNATVLAKLPNGAVWGYFGSNCNGFMSENTDNTSIKYLHCQSLSSVGSIPNYAFWGCTGLMGNLTIPHGITTIGERAFQGCANITGSLIIPDSITIIGATCFYQCGFTGALTFPNSVTSIGDNAFGHCVGLTGNLTIPNSVTYMGTYAFSACSGFTGTLTIPTGITSIGNRAFAGCVNFIGALIIPNNVTSIGEEAFNGCAKFTSLTLSSSLTAIAAYVFWDCIGFTGNLVIPSGVTTIGTRAFQNCRGFNGTLTIPSSVTGIGGTAFYYMYQLTRINCYATTPPTLDTADVFGNVPVTLLHVPNETKTDYDAATYWTNFEPITEDL